MTRAEFSKLAESRILFLDGATGSNLFRMGMPRNVCTEQWILEHPEYAMKLQKAYADAGSDIIYAPTFGANSISLARHGLEKEVKRLNTGLVQMTRKAVGNQVLVAGDLTTTGEPLEPIGELEESELSEVYAEQLEALIEAGVDLLVFETMLSVQETAVGLRTARSMCDLPVLCTLTVGEDGKGLFGGSCVEAVWKLREIGASAVGINCSFGPENMLHLVQEMKAKAKVPVIVKPNAGQPEIGADGLAQYKMQPEEFASHMKHIVAAGAGIIGGCCGTTPEFISRIVAEIGK